MKIEYFFPVFKEDNIKEYLTNFKKTDFFKKNENYKFLFVCHKEDKANLEYLSKEALKNENYKILVSDKNFTYNDAFSFSISHFKSDIVLLGDTKILRIDLVFEKCLEKYDKKASVVHIIKKHTGFKGFWKNLGIKIYNFFVKIFTGKKDRCNVISTGLIDKHVIDVLKVLPHKNCFLKNTKNLKGFETRSIYIDSKTKTYKLNFKQKTAFLISSFVSLGLSFVLLALQILLNILIKDSLISYNIISTILILVSFITTSILFPKHIFDVRNRENRKVEFVIEEINKD
ncbi:MAG: hypothetical protein IJB10_03765 [Clostridia bacterium]|nr:hypothetical protein [Clostridia bacterium]